MSKEINSWPYGFRKCTKCLELKALDSFHKHRKCALGYNSVCKNCRLPLSKKLYAKSSKEQRLYNSAKARAFRKNREFSLVLEDILIPKICPVLGVCIEDSGEYAAAIDRKNPLKGYTKDNICVISKRANMLKNNASITELNAIIKYILTCEI